MLIVGAGGIGCPVALALARPGRTIGIVDPDRIDLSNLHRQVLYDASDVGRPKAEVAARRLGDACPDLDVRPFVGRLEPADAERQVRDWDVVVEATDDVRTKFLASDAAVRCGVPVVVGGAIRLEGTVIAVVAGRGACYRCLFEEPPDPDDLPTCAQAGVLGPVPGVIGGLAAEAADRALAGTLRPGITAWDGRLDRLHTFDAPPRIDCPACGNERPPIADLPGNRAVGIDGRCDPPGTAGGRDPGPAGGFTSEEIARYGRQILVPGIGGAGQRRIRAAAIEVAGDGDADEIRRVYLRAAGVGGVAGPPRDRQRIWSPAAVVAGCRDAVRDLLRMAREPGRTGPA